MNKILLVVVLLLFSCDDTPMGPELMDSNGSCNNCYLELDIPSLNKDSNGYYHLEFDENYYQTFTTIEAYIGGDYYYIGWQSDTNHCVEFMGSNQCSDVVNNSSYSGSDGYAHTVLGVYETHVGDTITVWCGYYDYWDEQYLDYLEIIVD